MWGSRCSPITVCGFSHKVGAFTQVGGKPKGLTAQHQKDTARRRLGQRRHHRPWKTHTWSLRPDLHPWLFLIRDLNVPFRDPRSPTLRPQGLVALPLTRTAGWVQQALLARQRLHHPDLGSGTDRLKSGQWGLCSTAGNWTSSFCWSRRPDTSLESGRAAHGESPPESERTWESRVGSGDKIPDHVISAAASSRV